MAYSKSVLSASLPAFRSFFSLQEPCREDQTHATEFVLDLKISLPLPSGCEGNLEYVVISMN